jgi:hypothetical protein
MIHDVQITLLLHGAALLIVGSVPQAFGEAFVRPLRGLLEEDVPRAVRVELRRALRRLDATAGTPDRRTSPPEGPAAEGKRGA